MYLVIIQHPALDLRAIIKLGLTQGSNTVVLVWGAVRSSAAKQNLTTALHFQYLYL